MLREAGGRAVMAVLGAGALTGAVEPVSGWVGGHLPLVPWNLALLVALGLLGGTLCALPAAALVLFVRRLPVMPAMAVACASVTLASHALDPLMPTWTEASPLPGWMVLAWVLILPGLWLAPSVGLRLVLLASVALLQVSVALPPVETWADDQAPLLVLITVDGLRADSIDPDGPIAELGRRGIRYDRAWAVTPHATPSNLAMLDRYIDGELDYDASCGPGVWSDGSIRPDYMADNGTSWRGWPTAGFVSSKLMSREVLGTAVELGVHDDDFALVQGLDTVFFGRLLLAAGLTRPPLRRDARYTVDAAIGWLDRNPGPAFVWVHLDDPVGPYEPGDPWDKRFVPDRDPRTGPDRMAPARPLSPEHSDSLEDVRDPDWVIAQYKGEVAKVEHHVGRMLDALPDDANIVLVGTHGEALGEHERWFRHGSARPAELRVPAIVVGPGVTPGVVAGNARIDLLQDPVDRPASQHRGPSHIIVRPQEPLSEVVVRGLDADRVPQTLATLPDGRSVRTRAGEPVTLFDPEGTPVQEPSEQELGEAVGLARRSTLTCAVHAGPPISPSVAATLRALGGTTVEVR